MDASNPRRSSAVCHHHCHHNHHVCQHHHHHLHFAPHHHHHLCHHPHLPSPAGSRLPATADTLLKPNNEATLIHSESIDEVSIQQEVADEEGDEMYDEDPVFVMTDEWKAFFAKSEAKRRLEKEQSKETKGKHKNKAG